MRRTYLLHFGGSAGAGFSADFSADVLVLGAGPAGLSAALSAAEAGARVVVLDRGRFPKKKNRPPADLNVFSPRLMEGAAIADSPSKFLADLMNYGDGRANPKLLEVLCWDSDPMLDWLKRCGLVFEKKPILLPGAPWPRACRLVQKPGMPDLETALWRAARQLGVRFIENAEAAPGRRLAGRGFALESPDGGARLHVKAIVAAGGGFARDPHLVARADRRLLVDPVDAEAGPAEPAMLRMLQHWGAAAVGLSFFDFEAEGALQKTLLRRPDNILLFNGRGERFVDESAPLRAVLSAAAKAQQSVRLLVDEAALKDQSASALDAVCGQPLTIAEAAAKLRLDPQVLADAIREKGEESAARWRGRICELRVRPTASLGGVVISEAAEAISWHGAPIPGVYAAGDIAGGIHGRHALPGSRLAAAVIFGRRAGENAVKFASHGEG